MTPLTWIWGIEGLRERGPPWTPREGRSVRRSPWAQSHEVTFAVSDHKDLLLRGFLNYDDKLTCWVPGHSDGSVSLQQPGQLDEDVVQNGAEAAPLSVVEQQHVLEHKNIEE